MFGQCDEIITEGISIPLGTKLIEINTAMTKIKTDALFYWKRVKKPYESEERVGQQISELQNSIERTVFPFYKFRVFSKQFAL